MIRVEKHGHIVHRVIAKRVSCECGCVFTYEKCDVAKVDYGDLVTCPECLKRYFVKRWDEDEYHRWPQYRYYVYEGDPR